MGREVGYLGPPGSFGEQAALLYQRLAGSSLDLRPFSTHAAIIHAVQTGEVRSAVVPVENSLVGAIRDTLDEILTAPDVCYCHEFALPVEHHLIAAPGTSLADIKAVSSHPEALAQCRHFLDRALPGVRLEAALSTAAAVQTAASASGFAAVGTLRAAELHGGVVLAKAIQDEHENLTRFVAIAREDCAPTGDDKTSIAFTVPHDRPGTLLGVLKELAERQINMTHIESRPSRLGLGIYIFLIDFQGHRSEPATAAALDAIERQSSFFRVLGSYPRFAKAPGRMTSWSQSVGGLG
jgi:prephenate dehydratase